MLSPVSGCGNGGLLHSTPQKETIRTFAVADIVAVRDAMAIRRDLPIVHPVKPAPRDDRGAGKMSNFGALR